MDRDEAAAMTRFCPSFWTWLTTWLPARWQRQQFDRVRLFIQFIGYPRSGHTLIGSLLNAHRHVLLAHELNALHYVRRRFSRDQLFYLLWQQDQAFESIGRRWTGYDYSVADQWQGTWDQLHVVGDKHGNGVTKLLGRRPELLHYLRETVDVPVRMIHVVRHPLDNITTMHCRGGLELPDAIEAYFELATINEALIADPVNEVRTVYQEDFVANPKQKLIELLSFMDLTPSTDYLHDCAERVLPSPRQSRHQIDWPAHWVREVARRSRDCSFLARYQASFEHRITSSARHLAAA